MTVEWRCGNGAGTCLKALRVDSSGTAVWSIVLDVAAGGPGLNYEFTTVADAQGTIISAWEQVGGDIAMARYDTAGTMLWIPSPVLACTETHDQNKPAIILLENSLYMAWRDNRPGGSGLYTQRFDLATGEAQWEPDGHPTIIDNYYIPTARIVPSIGGIVGIMDLGGTSLYSAMRVNSNGSNAWATSTAFASTNMPFYGAREELPDGMGGVVSFWVSAAGNIYGARIYGNGELGNHVGIEEAEASVRLNIRPNPTTSRLEVISTGSIMTAIELINSDGRITRRFGCNGTNAVIDVSDLPAGIHVVRVRNEFGWTSRRFIKH